MLPANSTSTRTGSQFTLCNVEIGEFQHHQTESELSLFIADIPLCLQETSWNNLLKVVQSLTVEFKFGDQHSEHTKKAVLCDTRRRDEHWFPPCSCYVDPYSAVLVQIIEQLWHLSINKFQTIKYWLLEVHLRALVWFRGLLLVRARKQLRASQLRGVR